MLFLSVGYMSLTADFSDQSLHSVLKEESPKIERPHGLTQQSGSKQPVIFAVALILALSKRTVEKKRVSSRQFVACPIRKLLRSKFLRGLKFGSNYVEFAFYSRT